MLIKHLFILLALGLVLTSCRKNNTSNGGGILIGEPFTEIEGTIRGRLAIDDSPFLVKNDIIVQSSDTLLIDAAVDVYFEKNKRLIVNGVIIARSTEVEPIIFSTFDGSNWLGISIINSPGVCEFSFCIIQQVIQGSDDVVTNGAIEIQNSVAEVMNCIFKNNSTQNGGGIYSTNSTLNITNNIFRENVADNFGGAMFLDASNVSIVNNTIYNNASYNYGGGIVLNAPVVSDIQNNIFYSNFSLLGDPRISLKSGDSSNVSEQYNYLAFGDMNPLFNSHNNLYLQATSPCINKGNPDVIFNDTNGTRNDQGAYGGPNGNW